MTKMNLSKKKKKKKKQIHRPTEQTCGCQRVGEAEGQIGSLGLVDANYYIQMDKQQGPIV